MFREGIMMIRILTSIDLKMLVYQAARKTNIDLKVILDSEIQGHLSGNRNFWEQLLEELSPYLTRKEQHERSK